MEANLALIPLFPLIGAVLSFLIGRKRKSVSGYIASAAALASFGWALGIVLNLGPGTTFHDIPFVWFSAGDLLVEFKLSMDRLSAVMTLVVTGIGTLIHFYSIAYMHEDESPHRFFAYLNLFLFSMLLLVLGGNLLVMFVGWEGVGLCSYLLIGFWFKNLAYAAAGRKAFVVNRIGDAGFLLGMFLLYVTFSTLDFETLKSSIEANEQMTWLFTAVGLCLFVGAAGKSAQIPLFVWLPDAMAGPTPVSALIHAATMVTAGVYMMARMHFVYELAPDANAVILLTAILTAIVAAITAVTQNDIKKVLAYSTVSQLGFMFIAAACGAYWVAIFHVVTHAFFKACLFLGAGSVIHGCHHEQDMREMGGLFGKMPITGFTYLFSTLAIAGIWPFAGYHSKHAILGALEHNPLGALEPYRAVLLAVVSFTALLTAFYMMRSFCMTFLGSYRGHAHPHESPFLMTGPLVVLATLATLGGLWLVNSLPEYLAVVLGHEAHAHHETMIEGILHSWVGILGVGAALILYTKATELPGKIYRGLLPLAKLSQGKFFFDEVYGLLLVRPLERLATWLWRFFDQGVIDGAVNGTAAVVDVNGELVRLSQTGQVRHYGFFMLVGAFVLLVLYLA